MNQDEARRSAPERHVVVRWGDASVTVTLYQVLLPDRIWCGSVGAVTLFESVRADETVEWYARVELPEAVDQGEYGCGAGTIDAFGDSAQDALDAVHGRVSYVHTWARNVLDGRRQ